MTIEMRRLGGGLCAFLMLGALSPTAPAAVRSLEVITTSTLPAAGSRRFGAFEPGTLLTARVRLLLNPNDPHNKAIVDIEHAPLSEECQVEATAVLQLLRPAHPNGILIVELPNRGASQLYDILNDLPAQTRPALTQPGNGFLLSRGYTLALIGWQADLPMEQALAVRAPVARGLTGYSRDQWSWTDGERTRRYTLSWPIAAGADLHVGIRTRADSELLVPRDMAVRMIDERTIEITRPVIQPASTPFAGLYEVSYTAKDPTIMGIGFAAVRDIASFLKYSTDADNPLAAAQPGRPWLAIATGVSQSGRAVRDLLYQGFNADERGRRVFDGMLPIIPGSRRSFTNARFAQPGRNPGPVADQLFPVDQFPFTYATSTDPLTGRKDGLLAQCRRSNTCPRVLELDSEYEMWGARGALLVTDGNGAEVALPSNVRAYMLAGAPHMNSISATSKPLEGCVLNSSPVIAGPVVRALFVDMEDWLRSGTAPPPSRFPSVRDHTLVPASDVYASGTPLPYTGQHMRARLVMQTANGPVVKGEYIVLLPKADSTGNAIAGIHLPLTAAPLGSFTGWNPQTGQTDIEAICDHAGGFLPLASTREARLAAKDSRPSLEELYPAASTRHERVVQAARRLVQERLLLPPDEPDAIATADAIATTR